VVVIAAELFEIRPRRAAADAEAQPPARQGLDRLHAMRKLDRVTQRHLQYADAEFDALGHRGERCRRGERVERRPPPSHRVADPDPGKPGGLDARGRPIAYAARRPG
jgi:hypothetical protein